MVDSCGNRRKFASVDVVRCGRGSRRERDNPDREGVLIMGPKFAVRENAVVKHSSNLETSEQSMNAQAKRFIQAIEPLQGVWQGTSYGSWGQLTEAWNTAMSGLNKALTDIKGRVGNAGGLYNQYEAEQDADLKKAHGSSNWDGTAVRI